MDHGTHTLQLGKIAKGLTNISQLQFAFYGLDAYDAQIDIVVEKSPA